MKEDILAALGKTGLKPWKREKEEAKPRFHVADTRQNSGKIEAK